MFCLCFFFCFACISYLFLTISIRPIIPTSAGPIVTKFAELVELWLQINDLKFVFFKGRCRDNEFLLVYQLPSTEFSFAWHSVDGGVRQEVQVLRWTQANQLTDQLTIINRRLWEQPGGLPIGFALHLVSKCTDKFGMFAVTRSEFGPTVWVG